MTLSQDASSQNRCTSPSQLFLATEEELRDVKRVHSHGQEEDLRLALQVVINRVEELVSSPSNYLASLSISGIVTVVKAQGSVQGSSRIRNLPESHQVKPSTCPVQQ